MNTYVASCAHCTRTTAFLTSSSAVGTDQTGTEAVSEMIACNESRTYGHRIYFCITHVTMSVINGNESCVRCLPQCHHDWLVQQLLQNVRQEHAA